MFHHSATCFFLSNNVFESYHVDIYSAGSFHLSAVFHRVSILHFYVSSPFLADSETVSPFPLSPAVPW